MSPWLYGRSELLISDHKAVKALMDVQVAVINTAVRRHIQHEVHKMLPGIPVFAEDPLRPLMLAGAFPPGPNWARRASLASPPAS